MVAAFFLYCLFCLGNGISEINLTLKEMFICRHIFTVLKSNFNIFEIRISPF